METSENFGGHVTHDTHAELAADGAGHPKSEPHLVAARPELTPEGETPGDGAGHARFDAQGRGARPEETGDGQLRSDNHSHTAVANGGGRVQLETHGEHAPAEPTSSGHGVIDTHGTDAAAGDEAGHSSGGTHGSLAGLIAELIAQHRQREGLHRAEKSLTLQIKGNCRWLCEGDKAAAKVLYDATMKKKPDPHPLSELFWGANLPFLNARNQIEPERLRIEARMEEIAAQFPVAEWWCSESGRNLLGLAQIIGETGDLWNYANPGKLWARLGVSVEGGQAKKRRKGVDNGYNAARRSVSWRIADSLFKGQSERVDKETGEVKRETGPYRVLYDERKVREIEKAAEEGLKVAPSAKIPKAKASEYRSEGHIHKRVLRYMEKRLLKHLWQAWRSAPAGEAA